MYAGLGVLGLSLWGAFLLYTTNQERLSSSVVRQLLLKLKTSENALLRQSIGENIGPEPAWYMGGNPWIDGQVGRLFLSGPFFFLGKCP